MPYRPTFLNVCDLCMGYLIAHDKMKGYKKCVTCGKTTFTGGMMIDWNDPKAMLSKHFTVGEATYLPKLKMYYKPNEVEKENILKLATKLDIVRDFIAKPFNVNIWIRPVVTKADGTVVDYNALIGGAKNSAHKVGSAVDFNITGMTAQEFRDKVGETKLEEWKLRCEDGVSWVHLDQNPVGASGNLIFKP